MRRICEVLTYDREIGLAVGDKDIRDEAEINDIAVHVRPAHRAQPFQHLFLAYIRHETIE